MVESKLWFYILGSALGIFVGPVQAASRSMMAHLSPPDMRGEMFGIFALSGKITAFLGPALVGAVTLAVGSQRWGMSVIIILLIAGLLVLLPLREPARSPSAPPAP